MAKLFKDVTLPLMTTVSKINEEIHELDSLITPLEEQFQHALASLPNLAMDDIKIASDPKETEFGVMAVVVDPDGRKVELYKK